MNETEQGHNPAISSIQPRDLVWAALLAATTIAIFLRCLTCEFVAYDDNYYVTKNPFVNQGLSWASIRWAFDPATFVAANWHPLTLISHMLDCQLYGLTPWGHHLTNILLHGIDTALVFLLLKQMTGRIWSSLLVAALFGWHPLHVESVAWVAERKDVLSAFFGLLALMAYVRWTRQRSVGGYLLVAALLLCGLLAKSMLVTWPALMLLLDAWPLERISLSDLRSSATWRRAWQLVLEKVPLFALVAAFSVQTFSAQRAQGAVREGNAWDWSRRLVDGALSYTEYINLLVWPQGLAVLYPSRARIYSISQIGVSVLAVLIISAVVIQYYRRYPYLAIGWFWFLGTLVPVIGIVPFGAHSIADRYTYLPSIGLFIVVAWGLVDLSAARPQLKHPLTALVCGWLLILGAVTWVQIGYWKSTETLFAHTVAVTKQNYIGHKTLANAYVERYEAQVGQMEREPDKTLLDRAVEEYQKSIEIEPKYRLSYFNLGNALRLQNNVEAAAEQMQTAFGLGLNDAGSYAKLGEVYMELGRLDEALAAFNLALDPATPSPLPDNQAPVARLWRARVIARQGHPQEALAALKQLSLEIPGWHQAGGETARILALHPDESIRDTKSALVLAEEACRGSDWADPDFLSIYAAALAADGRWNQALEMGQRALVLAERFQSRDPLLTRKIDEIQAQLDQYRKSQLWFDPRFSKPAP